MPAKAKTKTIDYGNSVPANDQDIYRLIFRSWGWDKVGKNHFGFTMPGPILGLYFDPGGVEGVAQKFLRGEGVPKKKIRHIQYQFNKRLSAPNDEIQDYAIKVRDQWIEDFRQGLTWARSIQVDETEFWEVSRYGEFGRESARAREYGPLNGMMRGLIQEAFDAGVNLQLIQKVKDEWKDDKPTGGIKPVGFNQAGNIVQVSLEHFYDEETKKFGVNVAKCRQNTAIWGETYMGLDFPTLGQLVYPESSEEDWL